ncbi:MAG: hypothetical protein U0746_01075 [Gemmataceae bacterium]
MTDRIATRLSNGWKAWTGFWFTPADPTPLCLMRIVAGLLTLYVHVAYTFDLQAFFGPKGWYERELAVRARREFPNLVMPPDWDGFKDHFKFPPYLEIRKALREFVTNLAERKESGERVMNLLGSLPPQADQRTEFLTYIQYALGNAATRDERLSEMVEGKSREGERLPAFVLNQPKLGRENLRDDLKRLFDTLPADKTVSSHIFTILSSYGDRDISALRRFMDKLFKMSSDQRKEYLDYVEHWGFTPDMAYTLGHRYYSPFFHTQSTTAVAIVHGLHLLVIALFAVGYQTRITSVLTWLAGLAYFQRNPLVLFGQDTMMNLCLFYLMMAPCGQVWSVDAWLAKRRGTYKGTAPSVSANFVLRGLQIHYCLMYMSAGLSKLKGQSWWNGTAPWGTMTNPEFSPLYIQPFIGLLTWLCQTENRWLWEAYMSSIVVFTLVLEIGFPFLVWTRLRPIMVAGAILLHLGIAIYMGLIVFSMFMMALQLCYMTPTSIKRVFGSP